MDAVQMKLKEEAVWHLVSMVGINPPQGSYMKYAKRLLSEPQYSLLRDVGVDENSHVILLGFIEPIISKTGEE